MFTGLIEAVGVIEEIGGDASGARLRVATALGAHLHPGDSIAVNGVCLTATEVRADGFAADVSRQTLAVTSLGGFEPGRAVNLERPLRADARLGGHFVLGHVDGTGTIAGWRADGDGFWLDVDVPSALAGYLIPRGSIAVDGISLTIARLTERRVGMQIVPFTFSHTALRHAAEGDVVNLEVDVLGKYVARLLEAQLPGSVLTETPQ
jgi:riboflavin synthase